MDIVYSNDALVTINYDGPYLAHSTFFADPNLGDKSKIK